MDSLTKRHLVERLAVGKEYDAIARETQQFYTAKLEPITYSAYVKRFSGSKRKKYESATNWLVTKGMEYRHQLVHMFIKPDKFPLDALKEKAPRAIQYRSPEFNIAFGTFVVPLEEYVYENVTYGVISKSRVVAKGLNPIQRAALVLEKVRHFSKPKYLLIDHSTFDATISPVHLRATHRKYLKLMPFRKLKNLLKAQIHNTGYTRLGTKYTAYGTRMSGDCDTALGNSIINLDCIYGVLKMSGITKYDILVDGDDSIVIVEESEVVDTSWFARFGFNTKYAEVSRLCDVEFCQSKIVTAGVPKFVRKPFRCLSNAAITRHKHLPFNFLAGLGKCELAINQGVPILQEWAYQLSLVDDRPLIDRDDAQRMMGLDFVEGRQPITDLARLEFADAFGISPALQVAYERNLTSLSNSINNERKSLSTRQTWARYADCSECSCCCRWNGSEGSH